MLGGYASDFYCIAIQRKVLGPWTDITGSRTGMSPFGHSAPIYAPDARYITLPRSTVMSEHGSISVSRDILVFVSDNFKQVNGVYRVLGAGNITSDWADVFGSLVEWRVVPSEIRGLHLKTSCWSPRLAVLESRRTTSTVSLDWRWLMTIFSWQTA